MTSNLADLKIGFPLKEVISAINELEPDKKEFFIENLLAATSPEYLQSIKEAREDYRKQRIVSHKELFNK